MRPRLGGWWRGVVAGLATLAIGGCTLATDLVNPTLASTLGLPGTQGGERGVVLMAFNNRTRFPAVFLAFEAKDERDPSSARNFLVEVQPGEVANEIIECPVAVLGPGSVGADFALDTAAAFVAAGQNVATVTYAGGPLFSGTAFRCGAVIEVQLVATATGGGDQQEQNLRIVVRVIPGR